MLLLLLCLIRQINKRKIGCTNGSSIFLDSFRNSQCNSEKLKKGIIKMGTYLFLFHFNLHDGMDKVRAHSNGIELNSTIVVVATVSRAATRKVHSVDLALDASQVASTDLGVAVNFAFTATEFARMTNFATLLLFRCFNLFHSRSP